MNVLETILSFLTTLARIIFPRRKRPVAGDDLCPCPLPEPPIPPLPVERGNGSNPRRSRSDSLPPLSPTPEADWLSISGYTMMLAGGIGSLYKVLAGKRGYSTKLLSKTFNILRCIAEYYFPLQSVPQTLCFCIIEVLESSQSIISSPNF